MQFYESVKQEHALMQEFGYNDTAVEQVMLRRNHELLL